MYDDDDDAHVALHNEKSNARQEVWFLMLYSLVVCGFLHQSFLPSQPLAPGNNLLMAFSVVSLVFSGKPVLITSAANQRKSFINEIPKPLSTSFTLLK